MWVDTKWIMKWSPLRGHFVSQTHISIQSLSFLFLIPDDWSPCNYCRDERKKKLETECTRAAYFFVRLPGTQEKRKKIQGLIARQSTKKFSGYACVRKHNVLGNRPSHKETRDKGLMGLFPQNICARAQ